MIYIGFALCNPFSRRFYSVADKVIVISKNKTIEVELFKSNTIVGGSLRVTAPKEDHAGFSFDVELFGYSLFFTFYDNRHRGQR